MNVGDNVDGVMVGGTELGDALGLLLEIIHYQMSA
jgi:hypothetical protein